MKVQVLLGTTERKVKVLIMQKKAPHECYTIRYYQSIITDAFMCTCILLLQLAEMELISTILHTVGVFNR